MKLMKENTVRKIDGLGRISVPKGMRNRFCLEANQELDFYTLIDDNGEQFVCFTNHRTEEDNRYHIACDVLKELGIEIPNELQEKIN